MCERCVVNWKEAPEETRVECASTVRGIASRMMQAARAEGHDPLEILAALEASVLYWRAQFDEGLQAVAGDLRDRVHAAILEGAKAKGRELTPIPHDPLQFAEVLTAIPVARARAPEGRPARTPPTAPRRARPGWRN
jgi:hypothetical protein